MRSRFMVSAVLAAAVLSGCKKEDSPNATNPGGASTKPTTAPAMGTGMPGAMDTATADASKKLSEIQGYIADKKYDMADKTLKGLEDRKASLPASISGQLGNLRTMIDANKMKSIIPSTMPSAPMVPSVPSGSVPSGSPLPSTSIIPSTPRVPTTLPSSGILPDGGNK